MDLLADELDLSPPALSLLAAYDDAIQDARAAAKSSAPEPSPAAATEAADARADEGETGAGGETDAADSPPPLRIAGVPRLEGEGGGDADLHGVLLAAGALDVDLSDVAAGVRYTVTRAGRGLLAKAA